MIAVGDTVVTMAAPGRFTVLAVAGSLVTIQNAEGVRKTVVGSSLRSIEPQASSAS